MNIKLGFLLLATVSLVCGINVFAAPLTVGGTTSGVSMHSAFKKTAVAPSITMLTGAVLAPLSSGPASAAITASMMTNGGIPSSALASLAAIDLSQTDGNESTLRFTLEVESSNPFSPHSLRFTEWSSDVSSKYPNGTLAKTVDYSADLTYVYTLDAVGEQWVNPTGPTSGSDTNLTSGYWNEPVNGFFFAGCPSSYYQNSVGQIQAYIGSFGQPFTIYWRWDLVDANDQVIASVTSSISLPSQVTPPNLSISLLSSGQVQIGYSGVSAPGQLQFSPTLSPPAWTNLTGLTNSSGVYVTGSSSNAPAMGFYRLVVQP